MYEFLIPLFASLITTYLIIRYQHIHAHLTGDHDFSGPQKNHEIVVPRIGGISIAIGVFLIIVIELKNTSISNFEASIFMCSIPAFAIGLSEDLTKNIGIRTRLIFTALSALLLIYYCDVKISSVGIPPIDPIFTVPLISLIFTAFAITGFANAYNIIDGLNGLACMIAIITLFALGSAGYELNDPLIVKLCTYMIGGILGLFFWNFPKGLIFIGDGGAYLLGIWIATITILIINRHSEVSPWFAVLINGYPILETIYTIFRRTIVKKVNVAHADAMHLHSIIFRRISKKDCTKNSCFSANPKAAVFICFFSIFPILTAVIFMKSTQALIAFCILYSLVYVIFYNYFSDAEKF